MKLKHVWLLALLAVLAPMTISTTAIAEETQLSGSVEIGVTGTDLDDNAARVNEYVKNRTDQGAGLAGNLDLEYVGKGAALNLSAALEGSTANDFNAAFDSRVFKLDLSFQEFDHWKDHETLDQMGATARDDIGGSQPTVITDKILADVFDATGATVIGGGSVPYDPAAAYVQELNNDYLTTRREFKGDTSLALPVLPNVTFHAGLRVETRKGMEQAISLSKCDACHVSAAGKNIDERTEDLTFGATGKFGPVTIDYEYLTREFTEDSATALRTFDVAGNGRSDSQLLYEGPGDYPFARTPDSEKDSHSLKARVDLPQSTILSASYVKSNIESSKAETQDEYILENDKLKTELESFSGKVSKKFDNLRISLYGSKIAIEADDNSAYFPERDGVGVWPGDSTDDWHTAATRETTELGIEGVYRLARGTTLRLGYEYEEEDREEEDLGETETNTFKASVKSRLNNQLSGRFSYQYQDIDSPLPGAHVGIAQGDPLATEDPLGSGLWYYDTADFNGSGFTWYWTDVYPNRQLESTSLPDEVHEAKAAITWAPSANIAATFSTRVRMEENNAVGYEQDTYIPAVSINYAPSGKLNMTMAYSFNKQETENQMCVGWYHG